ncbi:zonular occludens toxin domain-containing protein [Ideonella sp.]|uniref:zonular occludens toxin domain-containing protein n=1 Tax=Ideonella sp. TaxID=1929293 RepID=UPI00351ACDA4
MITLITGAPGAGKSAAMMAMIQQHYAGRLLYVDGVPDLKLEHVELDAKTWPDTVPDGSLIVIDEVQRIWRPTGPGQKPGADVAMLETHRHRGLDFIIVTQAPRLVHTNVRTLVGRHVHLRDTGILGRYWYEWPECSENLAWRTAPISNRYRLPKHVFGQYKSASLHVKPVRGFPKMLAVALLAIVGFAWMGYRAVSSFMDKRNPQPAAQPASVQPAGQQSLGQARPQLVARSVQAYRAQFIPVVPGEPLTAPAYDQLRKIVRMPRIVGGWCEQGQHCTCYDQDGNIARVPEPDCRVRVQAPSFDPYFEPKRVGYSQHQASLDPLETAPVPSQAASNP